MTTATTIPMAFEMSMPIVVPYQTEKIELYSTASATVANWVLSPISAIKKATVTVQNGLKANRLS
jgi:hypothetical protein